MKAEETFLNGCYIIQPSVYEDDRGYFFESFNKKKFKEVTGIDIEFVQDNQSKSSKGVLRGLHYQTGEHAQAKLVRVTKGKVLDVCVDLRPNSNTFGKYFAIILDEQNKKQLFVPRGFAHGFLVLEDNTIFNYKCDNFYCKEAEEGIIYNDAEIGIDWGTHNFEFILSERDSKLPMLQSIYK